MASRRRDPELTRLYLAAGLAVLVWVIFQVYKLTSARVEDVLDPTSRWALLALGLANVLAIGTLLFIVARSLAKLYFERRSGILGARLRTKLVLALLAVGIAPSLMLFLVGREFISKNVDRWFRPETRAAIGDGKVLAEAFREQAWARLEAAARSGASAATPGEALQRTGVDLVAQLRPADRAVVQVRTGLTAPLPAALAGSTLDTSDGLWLLRGGGTAEATERIYGLFLAPELRDGLVRTDRSALEAGQIHRFRETLETLPQSTFLFLTLLSLFAAVWVGLALSKTISEPVRALAKAAQRVGTGDLEVSLPVQGEDELAFLSASFNRMIQDLKEGREAITSQAARIESQRLYLDQLLEALPVGVLSWQADGPCRVINTTARRWIPVDAATPAAEAWAGLATAPWAGELESLREKVRRTGRARQEDLRLGGESGRPVRAMLVPSAEGGQLAVLEDLTALVQAEKQAAWQEVARRMAHEVKNPLTPIKLTAQRLLRRVREGRLEPGAVSEGAETILAEVNSLSRLVDSFSRFAKLPAPQFRDLDAGDLVRQVEALYRPNHPAVHWTLEVPPDPLPVRWDGDMVRRALINLVDNALAATGGSGRLRVALLAEGGHVRLEVEDDGSGVAEDARVRLFEPYFSTKRKGTGLGLAIARKIAQDHGGEAEYEALPKGSLFRLILPMTPGAL